MNVRCPVCGKQVKWESNSFRPFCSLRCKMIDLGRWLDGKYCVQDEEYNAVKDTDEEKED